MLFYEQNMLLFHLSLYQVADKETCYIAMGYKPDEYREASYTLRPLMRYNHITRRSDGLYSIKLKGRKTIEEHGKCMVFCGGDEASRKRVAYISKVAALLSVCGVYPLNRIPVMKECYWFIPAPYWRKVRQGTISTVRFAGMLFMGNERLAVYHIGDGDIQWQTYAERSLFFETYGKYEDRATGMLMICNDGRGEEIAMEIIKHTLWRSKTLIKKWNDYIFESDKKRKISKSPIQLHSQYNKVYLTEQSEIKAALNNIRQEDDQIRKLCESVGGEMLHDPQGPNFEDYPRKFYANPANDLLRYIYMIIELKTMNDSQVLSYRAYLPEKYVGIADNYNLNLEVNIL